MIDSLNAHLPLEISAHTLYAGYAQQFRFWGYPKLADYFAEAQAEELEHANKIMNRIMQLGGMPDYMPKLAVKAADKRDIPAMLKARLATEEMVLASVTNWMQEAEEEEQDFETYRIGQELVQDTESDIEWAKTQLALIEELGVQNYLQAML